MMNLLKVHIQCLRLRRFRRDTVMNLLKVHIQCLRLDGSDVIAVMNLLKVHIQCLRLRWFRRDSSDELAKSAHSVLETTTVQT